jgi:glutamate synthase (NADPH/NADH) small chain
VQAGDLPSPPIDATGRHVVIIGGGDTGVDCLATANRQGAASVRLVDHNPCPPPTRDSIANPWPQWPHVHTRGFAHEEGVDECWQAEVHEFVGDTWGRVAVTRGELVDAVYVAGDRHFEPADGDADFEMRSDLVLLSMGFDGVERRPLFDDLGVEFAATGAIAVDAEWRTSTPRVYACGDSTRGASLVGWAIAEGRSCAAAVHAALTGEDCLPRPVAPADTPL